MNFDYIRERLKQAYLSPQRNYYLGSILTFLLVVLFLIKGCMGGSVVDADYLIGQDPLWIGLNLQGKEQNLTAFNHNLLAAIGKQENIRFSTVAVRQNDLYQSLENDKVQGILTIQKPSPVQKQRLLFSKPYFLVGPVLVIPKQLSLDDWNKLPKKSLAVESNKPVVEQFELDPSIDLKFYSNTLEAFKDLSLGKIDGALFPAIVSYVYTNTFYENELHVVTAPLDNEGLHLVTKRGSVGEELIEKFDTGLESLQKEGIYRQLIGRWGLVDVDEVTN